MRPSPALRLISFVLVLQFREKHLVHSWSALVAATGASIVGNGAFKFYSTCDLSKSYYGDLLEFRLMAISQLLTGLSFLALGPFCFFGIRWLK